MHRLWWLREPLSVRCENRGQDGEDGVGFDSITTPVTPDGTTIITLSNGDTITLDLNHNHPQYPKYMLLEHELEYEDIPVKDPETLYLIINDETAPQDGGSSV